MVVAPPGPRSRALANDLAELESPAFEDRRQERAKASGEDQSPVVYARAWGSNVEDVDGNVYVDLVAGFGALLLGHGDARVEAAVRKQSQAITLALGDVYATEPKIELLRRLATLFPEAGARVMLGSSGADAITAALKTAVLATGKSGVVAFEGAYHGLTHGPLAVCGLNPRFREPFVGQTGNFARFAPYPATEADLPRTLAAVDAAFATGTIGAVVVEPILGRGGCVVPPASFLPELRRITRAAGALLVVDEIWTGFGRSGATFATPDGVIPDVICVAKGLGGGYPISACIGSARAMDAWGAHGGGAIHTATHFGWPVACAAALATLDAIAHDRIAERAREVGDRFRANLAAATRGTSIRDVRGRGLMIGLEVDGGAGAALALGRRLLAEGWLVLTGGTAGDVLTLTPALTIDEGLLDAFVPVVARLARG